MAPKNAMRIEPKKTTREEKEEEKIQQPNSQALNTVGHNFIEMKILMS